MNRYFSIICLSLTIGLASSAQSATLRGRALDIETKNLIRDVNVLVIETGEIVPTNRKGVFEITKLPAGDYTLVATHVGYDQSDTLRVTVVEESSMDIFLRPMPWVLNDVVVTGTRSPHLLKDVPVQTEVISKRDFIRTGARTVDEALTSSIGIIINTDFSGQGATIRGVEGDRILILVDGERAVGRVRGSIDLSQYALANVKKIEIVKGTGSTLYGSDAMGGVINIITENPQHDRLGGNLAFDYGTYRSLNPAAELSWGNETFGFDLGGRFYSTQGFDLDKSTLHTNGQDAIDRFNLNFKGSAHLSRRWTFTQSFRFMREKRAWIETELDEQFIFIDDETNDRYEASTTLNYLSGDNYSMKLRAFGTIYQHDWEKTRDVSGFLVDRSDTEDRFMELAYSSNYVIGQNHVVTYGFDYTYQDISSSELETEDTVDGLPPIVIKPDKSTDGYLQYEYSPHPKWNFLPGVRWEHHSSFGSFVNPSINVMYTMAEHVKVRGFVGRGYRVPSTKQQYLVFDHLSAGYVVYGSEASIPYQTDVEIASLTEERSINSSLTAEFSYGTIGLHRLTYFYNHLDNLIDFQLVGFYGPYWRGVYIYQNLRSAVTQGIEWESRVRLSSAVDLSFSYDYLHNLKLETDSVIIEEDGSRRAIELGNKLTNRPSHTIKFNITGLWPRYNMGATFWGTYQSNKLFVARTNTGGNEDVLGDADVFAPHRTTLNLNVFKRFSGGTEIFVRMENLLDQTDLAFGYWPGFQVFGGVKYDWGI